MTNFGDQLGGGLLVKGFVLCIALLTCRFAATLLYYLVERIAMQWSESVKFKIAAV